MSAQEDRLAGAAKVAAAMGEPARERMLYTLLDGRARTATELSVVAGVSASTASAHLARLRDVQLVKTLVQGRHRYYRLAGEETAALLEALSIVARGSSPPLEPSTPVSLLEARTCYDHMAGRVAVQFHDRLLERRWLLKGEDEGEYELSPQGETILGAVGIDTSKAAAGRRRFAYACLDWSERKPHVGGALGAAVLAGMLRRGWMEREVDSRALAVTKLGRRELRRRFDVSS